MKTKTYSYPAIQILQSGSAKPLVLLAANAAEIDQWVGIPQKLRVVVDDVNTELLGFQRDEDPDRIAQIAQFYESADNVLQNPLLCAIRRSAGLEVSFLPDLENEAKGTVQIKVLDRSAQSLLSLFSEARELLEQRVPDLQGKKPSDRLVTRLRAIVNGEDASEKDSIEDSDPVPLEEALTEQSHIAEFWDAIAAREQVLSELGNQFLSDDFLGFSRQVLEAYLRPVILVDGQHRLLGALQAADIALEKDKDSISRVATLLDTPGADAKDAQLALKVEKSRILPISLLLDERPEEHVFQFVIVNQKATPVKAALLGTIISTSLADDELGGITDRLEKAGVPLQSSIAITFFAKNDLSPFAGLVARGLLGDGTDKLPWSVLGQLIDMFRNLRGAKYFHDPKIDYADIWKRRFLDKSEICADWTLYEAPSILEYWRQDDGPWRDVFVAFWSSVRDVLGQTSNRQLQNYWGQPRTSNLFNKPSLLTLATDFFAYLVESKQTIPSIQGVKDLVEEWLGDVKVDYFSRDWKLSGVKKDSTGTRRQWSYLWFSHRRDPRSLPAVSSYSKIYKAT